MKNIKYAILRWMSTVTWKSKDSQMAEKELETIKFHLALNHYIILTWRSNHLTSYTISFAHYMLGLWAKIRMPGTMPWPKFARYSHSCINIERTDDPRVSEDYEILESLAAGVKVSPFDEVFNCKRVVLLEPNIPAELWQNLVERGLDKLGTMYDLDLDLNQTDRLSCIELVVYILKGYEFYNERFADILNDIYLYKNLDPQMLRDSPSFRVVYETK
jgi:hypothetical protein